ncbi:hypothetical protein BDW60DRAFT_146895 [Aspergillus nidulans var. acristatus]
MRPLRAAEMTEWLLLGSRSVAKLTCSGMGFVVGGAWIGERNGERSETNARYCRRNERGEVTMTPRRPERESWGSLRPFF